MRFRIFNNNGNFQSESEPTNMESIDKVFKSLENDIQAFEKMFQELEPKSKSECHTGINIKTQGKPPLKQKNIYLQENRKN